MAPLGNNSSTLNDEPCLSSYILQNFSRRKWPDSADVYVNCITDLFIFFFNCKKKNHEMACLLLSFGAGTNPFALFFGDSVIFFLWFNLLEFLWIYFTEMKKSRQNLILQSSDGSIIKHHLSLSLSLKQSAIFTKYRKSNIFNRVFVQLSFTLQQSQWQNLCVIIKEWLFFKTTKKQKIWANM